MAPNYRWWIPADGIRRDVIQADIQRYLGPEAVCTPGEGRDENAGRLGYWIAAYRTFTPEMIRDLKADSANFEHSGDRGPYHDSTIHRSRQHWGPSVPIATPPQPASAQRDYARSDSASTEQSAQSRESAYSSGTYSNYPEYSGAPRSDRDAEPSRRLQNDYNREYHQQPPYQAPPYATSGATYNNPNTQSTSSGVVNTYTHQPPQEGRGGGPYRGYPDYGQQPGQEFTTPRSQHQPYQQNSQQGSYPYSGGQSASSTTHPGASQGPRPGYYLASDGNYYPNSTRPSAA